MFLENTKDIVSATLPLEKVSQVYLERANAEYFLLNVTFTGQMQKVSDIVSCNC